MADPPCGTSVNVEVVTVDEVIDSLNAAEIVEPTATLIAPFVGVTEATVGGVLFPPPPPPPELEPPHPAMTRVEATSHQAERKRITSFSLGSLRQWVYLSESKPGHGINRMGKLIAVPGIAGRRL
jgi:hypothetical protein